MSCGDEFGWGVYEQGSLWVVVNSCEQRSL